jgi:hypothetical protein
VGLVVGLGVPVAAAEAEVAVGGVRVGVGVSAVEAHHTRTGNFEKNHNTLHDPHSFFAVYYR